MVTLLLKSLGYVSCYKLLIFVGMDYRLRRSKPPLSGSRSSLTNAYEPEEVESEEVSGEDGGD